MSNKPLIAVVGATGAQGGGLVRALGRDTAGRFVGRALTRRPNSEAARALAGPDVEVVAADLDDAGSLERAFAGAHGVFAVTNFWEHFSPERELAQAKNIATAARRAAVQHVIWSTLEDTRRLVPLDDPRMPTLMGKYKVPHFDAKGEADQLFAAAGVPTTYLLTSFYWDNLIHFGMGPKPGPDGKLAITLPMGDAKLPGIAVEDIGAAAYAIFNKGGDWIGRRVGIAGEHLTGVEMAAGLSEALQREIRYNDVPAQVYRSFGFPGADDLGNMFQFNQEFAATFCATRNVDATRALHPQLLTFRQWLARNKDRIPLDR